MVNMHCRFYYKSINYRVRIEQGKNQVHVILQPKPFSSKKGKKIKYW